MKKAVGILIAVLIIVYAGLSLLCHGGEYPAEKLLYKALRAANKIIKNPDVVPQAMFISTENDFQEVVKKYPATKTAKAAQMTLAKFYAATKKYDRALKTLDAIIAAPGQDALILSEARFTKGIIYESQNQWDRALAEYSVVRDTYKATPLGFQMPMYIGNFYRKRGNLTEAEATYRDAIVFYRNIARKNQGSELGYIASNFLTQAYVYLKKYEEAGVVIEDVIATYPSTLTYMQQLPAMEFIYVETLKNPRKAIAVYKQVKDKTKDAKFSKLLQKRIDALEAKNKK
jgi:tetratricopeptide (TPR) repeat protein